MPAAKKFPVKLFVVLLFAGGVAVFAYLQFQKGRLISHENRAVAHFNAQEYDKAITEYETLLPKLSDAAAKQRIRRQLAECWKAKGDDTGLIYEKSREFYRKAWEYDPDVITSDSLRRSLEEGK